MSYSVAYSPETKDRYPTFQQTKRKFPVRPIVWCVALIAAAYIITSNGVLRYCIPGDPDVTVAAFSEMVAEIREGETVRDAFVDFCKQVIDSGS